MIHFRTFLNRFRSWWRQRAVKQEIDEELRFHLEQRTAENIAAGMTPEEAAREARKRFGNFQSVREECRDLRGASLFEATWKDIKFGARMLERNWGFTIVAMLMFALGIGALSAVFSLIQGVLLTPPPYPEPQRVMLIQALASDSQTDVRPPTTEQWTGWQKQSQTFQGMAGYDWCFDSLILQDSSEVVSGLEVTSDYFEVIGVQPRFGRTFLNSEIAKNPESAAFIILGYELWQKYFHGNPSILGQKVQLSRHPPLTVVGVMPPSVRFLPSFGEESCPTYDVNARVDYWLPVEPDLSIPRGGSGNGPWSVVGRLRPGVTRAQAQAELAAISAKQAQANSYYKGLTIKVQPLTEFLNRDSRRLLLPLLAAVALVFLIACGNIAALLLARGLSRQQEYAVRCALGAGRVRLFRQVLVEALLLALLGSFFGLTLAVAIVRVFKAIGGFAIPRLDAVTVGWPMLAFCFAAAVVAAFLAGFVPALRASRLDATQAAKTFGPTSSLARKERFLLGGVTTLQTSMTMALLVGACLLIQTVVNLANLRPGYETQNILTMSVMKEYRRGMNNDFHRQALQRISALPGVGSAAFIDGLPLTGNQWTAGEVTIVGEPQGPSLAETPQIGACCVTEKYFDTMGMKIVAGRSFQASDIAKSLEEPPAVVIINQAMAQRFFPNENPLGKKIHFRWTPADHPSEIVGIVADSRDVSLTHKPEPELYFSLWQLDVLTKSLVVRTTTDPRGLIGVVRHELRALDPAVAIVDMKTMSQIRAGSAASQTFAMRLLIGFASIGSVLAILGIYGVLSLSTHSRKREMAIRMAVGAQRRDVLGLVLSDGLKLVALGLLAGVALAIVFARVLAGYLFGVGPTDLTTILLVAAVFTAAAMLACYFPARRATNTDPMAALRHD